MTNNLLTSNIDFDKLENIPYIQKFDQDLFQQEVNEYLHVWQQYEPYYDQISFIRAMECTNGCVQYAYRDHEPYALPKDQTKDCMNLSMKFIISKEITLPDGTYIKIDPTLAPMLDTVRQLYYDAFKRHDKDKLRQFYAQSVAQFNLVGEQHIDNAVSLIKKHYEYPFTKLFIFYGSNYMKQFLTVLDHEQEEQNYEEFLKVFSDNED